MKRIIATVLSLLITSSVFAGHHEDPNVAEIKAVYRAYVDDFVKKDFNAIASHFQAPMMQRSAQGIMVSDTTEDIAKRFKEFMANIQDGYKYSIIDRLDVTKIADSLYYADADFTRFNARDEVIYQGRSIYFFSNRDGAWKMFAAEQVESK